MENQSNSKQIQQEHTFSEGLSFEGFRQIMKKFANDRDWNQYHTPRNLLLAFTGEVGELCELFQWKGEVSEGLPEFSEEEKIRVGEEMADCLAYLTRLADQCKIDLTQAILRKMEMNAKKYPVEKCKGKSDKYTSYQEMKEQPQGENEQNQQEQLNTQEQPEQKSE
ncbi:hypothetical protein ABPG74_021541 [Tetrahymena malaccensis]